MEQLRIYLKAEFYIQKLDSLKKIDQLIKLCRNIIRIIVKIALVPNVTLLLNQIFFNWRT